MLEVQGLGVYDSFFDLGGDSLRVSRVHGRLQDLFGAEFSIVPLFDQPTIDALARHLAAHPHDLGE